MNSPQTTDKQVSLFGQNDVARGSFYNSENLPSGAFHLMMNTPEAQSFYTSKSDLTILLNLTMSPIFTKFGSLVESFEKNCHESLTGEKAIEDKIKEMEEVEKEDIRSQIDDKRALLTQAGEYLEYSPVVEEETEKDDEPFEENKVNKWLNTMMLSIGKFITNKAFIQPLLFVGFEIFVSFAISFATLQKHLDTDIVVYRSITLALLVAFIEIAKYNSNGKRSYTIFIWTNYTLAIFIILIPIYYEIHNLNGALIQSASSNNIFDRNANQVGNKKSWLDIFNQYVLWVALLSFFWLEAILPHKKKGQSNVITPNTVFNPEIESLPEQSLIQLELNKLHKDLQNIDTKIKAAVRKKLELKLSYRTKFEYLLNEFSKLEIELKQHIKVVMEKLSEKNEWERIIINHIQKYNDVVAALVNSNSVKSLTVKFKRIPEDAVSEFLNQKQNPNL